MYSPWSQVWLASAVADTRNYPRVLRTFSDFRIPFAMCYSLVLTFALRKRGSKDHDSACLKNVVSGKVVTLQKRQGCATCHHKCS